MRTARRRLIGSALLRPGRYRLVAEDAPDSDPITVTYHREGTGWWAESGALPGWSAAGASIDHVRQLAREGVSFATGQIARTRGGIWITDTPGCASVDPAGSETFDLLSAGAGHAP
jgi:predicted RNase H-like HicB family nuclease